MPPQEQRAWLEFARTLNRCTTSVDMFEPTAMEAPDECRALCYSADLTFMNEEEWRLLFTGAPLPSGDIVLKRGPGGASVRSRGAWTHVPASPRTVLDSTGAGEFLAGAYLSIRAMGLPVEAALRYAVRAASAKVVEFGVDGENLRRTLARIHSEVTGGAF
jgi:ribokinase